MWYAHSGTRRAASFQRDQMLQGRTVTHMNGGKYIPPYRKRLADDLLDKAEARETESLKDVLIRHKAEARETESLKDVLIRP